MAGQDDTRPPPDREGAGDFMAAALRPRRPGGRLAASDRPVLDAFGDEVVARLAGTIGCEPEPVARALAGWASREASEQQGVDPHRQAAPSRVRDELQALVAALSHADDLVNTALSEQTEEALLAQLQPHTGPEREGRRPVPYDFAALARLKREWTESTIRLDRAARTAAEEIEVPRGRPRHDKLRRRVAELGDIYAELTGRRPGRVYDAYEGKEQGPFLPFCHLCLEAMGLPTKGLAKAVEMLARSHEA